MKQYIYNVNDADGLRVCLFNEALLKDSEKSRTVLVSIRLYKDSKDDYNIFYNIIKEYIPKAVVIGQTTYGGIAEGLPENDMHTISILMFESSSVHVEYYDNGPDADVYKNGALMREKITDEDKFVFFHITADTVLMDTFAQGFFQKGAVNFQIAGAGAGVPQNGKIGKVACEDKIYSTGVVALCFSGDELNVHIKSISGLFRVSNDYIATKAGSDIIYQLGGKKAIDVYRANLGFDMDKRFLDKCLAFPLVTYRGGVEIARAPVGFTEDGGLQFAADVKEGENYCICYVDNRLHIENQKKLLREIVSFQPECILVYSCISRKGLIKTDVGLETLLFESIADTSGFFTHGEIVGTSDTIHHMNTVTLTVSMREGQNKEANNIDTIIDIDNNENDMEGFHIRALLNCISYNIEK